LWVKAGKLLPVENGGNIRSYHIARHLAKHHELTFLSYYDGAYDSDYERELTSEFPGAVSICTGKSDSVTLRRGLDYVRTLPSPVPYAVNRFSSRIVRARLQDWFLKRRFEVAVCDFLDAAVNFPRALAIPSVLFQHNVESEIWRRHVLTQGSQAKKLFYGIEFLKMLRYEENTVKKFQRVIAVSEHDRRLMAAWTDARRISVVPTGVDQEQYRPHPAARAAVPLVVFVGAMDWEPNVDAAEYFCQEIWPIIAASVPDARFRIVGRNPAHRVQRLASASIEVTGRVPSVADHLGQAAVVVVPLRVGGGTRLKIYEAMAAGRAVVSTSVGAEGLDVHHGRDIILADNPGSFAQAVLKLLGDAALRSRYEREAAAVAARYDWPSIGMRFAEVLEQASRPGLDGSTC
jgi:glycosyltransferase involved in cell wall biosynthesis